MSMNSGDWLKLAQQPIPAVLAVLLMVIASVMGFIFRGWFL